MFGLAFIIPVFLALRSRPTPDRIETRIDPVDANSEAVQVPAAEALRDGEATIFRFWLSSPAPNEVITHPELRLLFFHSDRLTPYAVSGRITVRGTPCTYDTRPGARVLDLDPLTFVRSDRCRSRDGIATGELDLTMRVDAPGDLGIYARDLADEYRARGLIYVNQTEAKAAPVAIGWFVDDRSDLGLRRGDLLNYVWTDALRSYFVWAAVAITAGLVTLGVYLFPFTPMPPEPDGRRQFRVHAAIGTFCLGLALSWSYAVIAPPFQAADETHHFAAYLIMAGRPEMREQAMAWGARGHNSRIMGRGHEKFRPRDVGAPEPVWEGGFIPVETVARSSLTARFWQVLQRCLPDATTRTVFLMLRLTNAAVFALALLLTAAAVAWIAPVSYPQLLCFPFLLVPALPFFGMHVGESALVTSLSVVFATMVALSFLGGPRAHWLGPLIGLCYAGLLVGARNSLPMMPLVGTLLLVRVLTAPRTDRSGAESLIFWAGFGLGAGTSAPILTDSHWVVIHEGLVGLAHLTPPLSDLRDAVTEPWFPIIIAACGWVAEVLLRRPLAFLAGVLRTPLTFATRIIPMGVALLIVGSLLGSLYWDYPVLESIMGDRPLPLRDYLEQVATTVLTLFRLAGHGLLLTQSFWVGFGWLDTFPPAAFIAFLVALTGLSLTALLIQIAQRHEVRRFLILCCCLAGAAVTLAGYALAAYSMGLNIHGRYLIGWFLTVVTLCWTWPALWRERTTASGERRVALLLACSIFAHVFSLSIILRRYF